MPELPENLKNMWLDAANEPRTLSEPTSPTGKIDTLLENLKTENEALVLVINEMFSVLNEDVEEINELSKKTLGSYINSAAEAIRGHTVDYKDSRGEDWRTGQKIYNRKRGIKRAVSRLTNEDVETLTGIKVPKRSTRKHMVAVANSIANLRPEERPAQHKKAAMYFYKSNPNFDAQRFRKACGISDGMERSDYQKESVEQIDEISKATKDAYVAKRGSQLSSMMYGSGKHYASLTGKQQANAVKGIKRAMNVKEAKHNSYEDCVQFYMDAKDYSHEEARRQCGHQKTAGNIKEQTLLEKFKKVASEIRHLIKDKGYPQKRAVAAALSMKREGKLSEEKTKDTYDPRAAQAIANAYRERRLKNKNKKKGNQK